MAGVGIGAGQFLFSDYSALFRKAKRELAALRDALDPDTLFNFLCTTEHIYDWITNDRRVKSLNNSAQALAEANTLHKGGAVNVIRELCNGVKHLDLWRAPPPIRKGPRHWFERPFSSVRRSRRLPLNEGETKILFDDGGNPVDLLDLGRQTLDAWRSFLGKYGLPVPP
jgi:hypothetical protein